MSERFIKLIPSEESNWLLLNHGNAFLVLTLIATRARRLNGHPDGLIAGDAIISASDLSSLSRQNFRTALDKLVEFGYIKIISNGKRFFESRKSTIKLTIKSMLVNLLKSTIYDINSESNNQQINQQLTNSQPTANHKQERRRRDIPKDISQEDAQPAKPPRTKDPLIFNMEKLEFEGITAKDLADWKDMYPHLDIRVEILKATQWLINNPSKSKKKLWRKYLTGWLGRSNDYADNKKAYRSASGSAGQDRRTKDINGNPVESPYKGRF